MTSRSGLRLLISGALLLAGCALERSGLAPADGATPPFDAEIGRDGQVIDGQVIDDDAGRDSGVDGCTPGPELCNGVDDDCDPATPDGADEATLGAACDGDDVDLCADGAQVCDAGTLRCEDAPAPAPDLCNGVDDDCDGRADCADPDCLLSVSCNAEICDNEYDDDGDGLINEDIIDGVDNDGDGEQGGRVDEYGRALFDGIDNDGDGIIDEGIDEGAEDNRYKVNELGIYYQLNWKLSDKLEFIQATRFDVHDRLTDLIKFNNETII